MLLYIYFGIAAVLAMFLLITDMLMSRPQEPFTVYIFMGLAWPIALIGLIDELIKQK